jgi:hypothetical protein
MLRCTKAADRRSMVGIELQRLQKASEIKGKEAGSARHHYSTANSVDRSPRCDTYSLWNLLSVRWPRLAHAFITC